MFTSQQFPLYPTFNPIMIHMVNYFLVNHFFNRNVFLVYNENEIKTTVSKALIFNVLNYSIAKLILFKL